MTFLHPEILYGLFAIAIPVIIHLFNFRRYKKLYFSDISRLKRVTAQTKKQHKIKHLIILILRILTIAALVFAFAGPQINNDKKKIQEASTIAIICDNTYSMLAEGENGRLFEEARKNALDIVSAAPENTKFIILNGNKQNTTLTQQDAISALENLEVNEHTPALSQLIEDRNRLMKLINLKSCHTYILSDAQLNTFDFNNIQPDSINDYTFILFNHLAKRNIFVDSCNIHIPELIKNGLINLNVRITNPTDEDYISVPVKIFVNNKQKAVTAVDLKPDSYKDIEFSFNSDARGWNYGVIQIEDYPITFDDKLYFAYKTLPLVNTLIISDNNSKIMQYYQSDDIFNPISAGYLSADYSELNKYNLVILKASQHISSGIITQLYDYINNGGNLLYIPDLSKDISITNDFLQTMSAGYVIKKDTASTRVVRIAEADDIFSKSISKIPENADLPVINNHLEYRFPVASGVEPLITLLNGNDLLSRKRIGNGTLFILSTGIDNTDGNFAVHPLFIPVMHGIAEKVTTGEKPYIIIGDDNYINIKPETVIHRDEPVKLISTLYDQEIIPMQSYNSGLLRLELKNIPLHTGYHNITSNDTVISVLAANYNRSESWLNFYTGEDIQEFAENIPLKNHQIVDSSRNEMEIVINSLKNQSEFWKLFIIFALFTLLLEIIVIRFWK